MKTTTVYFIRFNQIGNLSNEPLEAYFLDKEKAEAFYEDLEFADDIEEQQWSDARINHLRNYGPGFNDDEYDEPVPQTVKATPITSKTAGAIRDLRTAKGMTQTELATAVGVAPARVSEWEAGKHEPSLSTLFDIAEALNVKPSEIVQQIEP